MTDTEKFLVALDPAEATRFPRGELLRPATTPASSNGHALSDQSASDADWPAAIERTPFRTDHPIDWQHLGDHLISNYLGRFDASHSRRLNGHAAPVHAPVALADLSDDWAAREHPVMLCEFLAYKSSLAYRSRQAIDDDLAGRGGKRAKFHHAISEFRFFDTSSAKSTIRYGDTQGFAFVHERTGYIVMRGTESFADIATDVHDLPTDQAYPQLDGFQRRLIGNPEPARHTGFATAWGAVAPDVEGWVADLRKQGRIDNVVLSGHSLGGALAILGAHHLASRRLADVRAVITFGAPMVGGEAFKAAYEADDLGLRDRTLRIEAAQDLVTLLARRWASYEHVGHQWRFAKRPLRPTWQLILFSPLVDAETVAREKVERIEDKRKRKARKVTAPEPERLANRAPERTWRQFLIGLALKALWYAFKIGARAFAAHSVDHRYGNYLSTLSYQKIRVHHLERARLKLATRRGLENERIVMESAYRAANDDLAHHLCVTRGHHPVTFRHLASRPVRVTSDDDIAWYGKYFENYIA